jgi:hypothetical protein
VGRKQLEDLIEFQTFMVERAGISALTASSYASLVRRVRANVAPLEADAITAYVENLQVRTCSLTKTAWRYYVEFMREKGQAPSNPFAPVVGLRRVENGSALGVLIAETKPVPVAAAGVELPDEIVKGLRAFLAECPPARTFLDKLTWDGVRRTNGLSDVPHPTEKYFWLPMEPDLFDALGEWGYGTTHPTSGPLIPKEPHSTVPFPLLPLLRRIEA